MCTTRRDAHGIRQLVQRVPSAVGWGAGIVAKHRFDVVYGAAFYRL